MNADPIPFSGNPLDRAGAARKDAAWLAAQLADPNALVLPLRDLAPLVAHGSGPLLAWRGFGDIEPLGPPVLLGLSHAGAGGPRPVFAAAVAGVRPDADNARFMEPMEVAALLPAREAGVVAQARSLVDWHARHGFCAQCGAPTLAVEGGAARHCDGCGAQHFPRTDPVVIMLPVRGDFCLAGRQSRFPPLMYSALAGFIEVGETIEDAVRREVLEEAGVPVGAVTYVASQPWPYPSSLMIGCLAEALSETINVDGDEIEEARWFSRAELRRAFAGDLSLDFRAPPPVAIAHHLMRRWAG